MRDAVKYAARTTPKRMGWVAALCLLCAAAMAAPAARAADDATRGRAQAAAQRAAQAKAREAQTWSLRALDRATGAELWREKLPAQPQPDGLSLDAAGRVFVTLETGEVLCFGGKR